MKWIFCVLVLVYMCYRAVYGAKISINSLSVEPVNYGKYGNYFPPGSTKTIACQYKNKNQQVQWLDPSGNTILQVKKNRIFTQKHLLQTPHGDKVPSLLLTFTDTWVEDSGEYECRSEGLSETISLCVIDPLTFVDTPTEVSVDEGRSYTLTCEARGRPEPRLVWYRNEEVISDDCNSTKYKVMTKFNSQGFQGQLTITSLEPDDAGSYTCAAIQEHKSIEDCSLTQDWNITLHVNHAPIFEDSNVTTIFAQYNDSVDLTCEPKAYPTPTFRWFSELNEDTLLNYPPEKIISVDNDTATKVTIVANALTFGMKYVCRATNNLGDASKTFTVQQLKKPNQPSEVNAFNSTSSLIHVSVSWSEDEYYPIEEIHIQCFENLGKIKKPRESQWKKIDLKAFELTEIELDDSAAKLVVNELEPETNYWIRARASNELGYSPWSNPILASTTAEEETTEEPEESEDVESESETSDKKEVKIAGKDTVHSGVFFAGGILVIALLFVLVLKSI